MKSTRRRRYHQTARADQVAATGRRILAAMTELFVERGYPAITLAALARRARVTLQTVLRRFGSKDGVLVAAAAETRAAIAAQRDAAPAGDVARAIANLFDHYEAHAPLALRLLEQEGVPAISALTAGGRAYHAAWVARVFAPQLRGLRGAVRRRRRAALVAVTDVTTWKILRRDQGLGRAQAERALVEMTEAIVRGR